jgi:hypothetical protein
MKIWQSLWKECLSKKLLMSSNWSNLTQSLEKCLQTSKIKSENQNLKLLLTNLSKITSLIFWITTKRFPKKTLKVRKWFQCPQRMILWKKMQKEILDTIQLSRNPINLWEMMRVDLVHLVRIMQKQLLIACK